MPITRKSQLRRRRQRPPHWNSNTRSNCEPPRRIQDAQTQRSTLQSPARQSDAGDSRSFRRHGCECCFAEGRCCRSQEQGRAPLLRVASFCSNCCAESFKPRGRRSVHGGCKCWRCDWEQNYHEVWWSVRLCNVSQWWCDRRRRMSSAHSALHKARLCIGAESSSVLEHRMHNLFRSDRLVRAVSFANDAPQFSDTERDPAQKLSLGSVTANVVTAGSTIDCKGASVSLGLAVSGRMAKLEIVFHDNGIHVIGIQSNDGRLTSAHNEIFTAAGEAQPSPSGVSSGLRVAWRMLSPPSLRTLSADLRLCSCDDTLRCNVVVFPCSAQSKRSGRESCLP